MITQHAPGAVGKFRYYEISLNGRRLSQTQKCMARDFFLSCRISPADLVITDYRGAFRVCCYCRSLKTVTGIRKRYRGQPVKGARLQIRFLDRHDWFDKWKSDYHIRSLGKNFMIVPLWEKSKFKRKRRQPIYLEPGSAFGSGYHETTRLMARLLESVSWDGKAFLDIGTGTGILSIVASKLGAREITAFDFDKPSAVVAKENFKINDGHNGHFFCANLKTVRLGQKFAVVGANLLSKTLLECRNILSRLVMAGGHLVVSGIGLQNLRSFQKGFSFSKLRCLKILRGRKWAALIYQKL